MTITELASEYADSIAQSEERKTYCKEDFIAGANSVIQEIEKKLDQLREDYKSLWTNTYLREFINQLKQ